MLPPYAPEPYVDFNQDEPRARMLEALKQVQSELGRSYPLWISGQSVMTDDTFDSTSPADPDRVETPYLQLGMDQHLAGQAIGVQLTNALGCTIKLPR